MKVVLITARFPEPGFRGDQLRARQQAELLHGEHELVILTGGTPSSPAARAELESLATVIVVPLSRRERLRGALGGLARGVPLQVGWMTPPRMRRLSAPVAATADVAIASTIRCLPEPLPAPTLLDHIDALSVNMRQRARLERRWPLRLGAALEGLLLLRHERRGARWCCAQAVVSPIDARELAPDPTPVVMPLVQDPPSAPPTAKRDIDVILTGNMAYPPNRDAAEWLAGEIAPRVRRRRPGARIMIAGRSASALSLAGVEVAGDVDDLAALLLRARVAVVPLRRGTGTPTKVLEAAAAGAAVVTTPWVAEAVGDHGLLTASDADGFAAAIERLLADETDRARQVTRGDSMLAACSSETVGLTLSRLLAACAGG
ncbi:MAG TPA: glycosyltransferase family 4 protein [Solirubrobacteraceae bacterium]|nr:glycosyltransferase family 4 protein [Solirubrobacteraceae bacterium]